MKISSTLESLRLPVIQIEVRGLPLTFTSLKASQWGSIFEGIEELKANPNDRAKQDDLTAKTVAFSLINSGLIEEATLEEATAFVADRFTAAEVSELYPQILMIGRKPVETQPGEATADTVTSEPVSA